MRRLRWLAAVAVIAMCAFAVYAEEFVFQDIKIYGPDSSSIFTSSALTFENLSSSHSHQVEFSIESPLYYHSRAPISAYFPGFTLQPGEKKHILIPKELFENGIFTVYVKVNGDSYHFPTYYDNNFNSTTLTANLNSSDSNMWRMPVSIWPDDINILKNADTIVLPENQVVPENLREALLDYAMTGGKLTSDKTKAVKAYGFGEIPDFISGKKNFYDHDETGMLRLRASRNNEDILNNVAIVLILFTICAGPATVIMYRKRKHLIFIAVPVVSIIFSGIIALIAICSDGIRQKVKFATYSVIDESRNKAVTYSEMRILHPMPIEKNIYLPPKSVIRDVIIPSPNSRAAIYYNDQQVVIKDAISPRIAVTVNYMNINEQPAKLDIISLENNKAVVKNNMGYDIAQLYVKTANGNIVYSNNTIPAGETAELTTRYDTGFMKINFDNRDKYLEYKVLEKGDYIAIIKEPFVQPPVKDKYADIEQIHIVFGLKSSPGGELWK